MKNMGEINGPHLSGRKMWKAGVCDSECNDWIWDQKETMIKIMMMIIIIIIIIIIMLIINVAVGFAASAELRNKANTINKTEKKKLFVARFQWKAIVSSLVLLVVD